MEKSIPLPFKDELGLFKLNSANYTIKINTENHSIDAGVLGDILLSYKKSVLAVASEVHDCQSIKVDVSTVETGCIEIHSVIDVFQSVLNPETIPNIILTIKAIVQLYCFLKGKPPQAVASSENGDLIIKNCDHSTITVNQTIYKGYIASGTPPFGKGEGLTREGVKSVQILDGKGVEQIKIDGHDLPSMTSPSSMMEDSRAEDFVVEDELVVETIPIEAPQRKQWGFIRNGQKIRAKIKDLDFIEKIKSHQISFRQGDRIKARLNIHREFNPVMQCWMVKRHQLLSVIEYIPISVGR